MKWYWNFRKAIARWIPDTGLGVGLGVSSDDADLDGSGELPLVLDVEGRKGIVYLSKAMWMSYGESAGWVNREDAEHVWDNEESSEIGVLRPGELELWRCVHCKRVTFLEYGKVWEGDCPCGEEFYPMSKKITHGSTHTIKDLAGGIIQSE